jgi:hypothetical protein
MMLAADLLEENIGERLEAGKVPGRTSWQRAHWILDGIKLNGSAIG